ncbi:MAG: sugar transferase [Pseudomonadota bacterium]
MTVDTDFDVDYSAKTSRPDRLFEDSHVAARGKGNAGWSSVARSLRAKVPALCLCLADLAGYTAAAALLFSLSEAAGPMLPLLGIIGIAGAVACAQQGLYPGYGLHEHEKLRRRVVSVGFVTGFGALIAALVLGAGWLWILTFAGLAMAVQMLLRRAITKVLCTTGVWGENAAVLGTRESVNAVRDFFGKYREFGINVTGEQCGRNEQAAREYFHDQPDMLLIAADQVPDARTLEGLRRRYDRIVLLADLPVPSVNGFPPSALKGEIGLQLGAGSTDSALTRRMLDLAIAVPAFIISLPVIVLAAIAIYIVDPGPVFYRQSRGGFRGRPFQVLKLRTMYQDAEARLQTLLASDPAMRAEWETFHKLRRDPRILPHVGTFLRASSLDELPQILNIIRGEMRVVGPRPFPDYHLDAMSPEGRVKRATVVPGLTGLWQISERSEADLVQQQSLDEFYIENSNLWFDIDIVQKTFSAVIRRSGA